MKTIVLLFLATTVIGFGQRVTTPSPGGGGGISGLTAGTIPKAASSSSLGNSPMSVTDTNVSLIGDLSLHSLNSTGVVTAAEFRQSGSDFATEDYPNGVLFTSSGGLSLTNNITNNIFNGHVQFNGEVRDSTSASGDLGEWFGSDGTSSKYYSPRNVVSLFDHHISISPGNGAVGGGLVGLGGFTSNSGTLTTVSGTAEHIGIWRATTGASTNGISGYRSDVSGFLFSGGRMKLVCIVRLPVLSTDADSYCVWIGFGDTSTTGDMTDGAYACYSHVSSSVLGLLSPGNWTFKTASNSARTELATATAAVANTFYVLEIDVNADGSSVLFTVDGVDQTPVTTNIPTSTGREFGVFYKIEKIAGATGTTQRNLEVDFTWLTWVPTTPL